MLLFMELTGLLPLIQDNLHPRLLSRGGQQRVQVLETAKPALLAALSSKQGSPVVVVTSWPHQARELAQQMESWLGKEAKALLFPEPDVLPFEPMPPDRTITWQRLRALAELAEWRAGGSGRPPVVIAPVAALMYRTIDIDSFTAAVQEVRVGAVLRRTETLARWMGMGYEPVTTVERPGTMAARGGIIDIYPPSAQLPVRIELMGDEVESMRLFSPDTQRSVESIDSMKVIPAVELQPGRDGRALDGLDFSVCQPDVAERLQRELSQVKSGDLNSQAWWLHAHLFNTGSFKDYLPEDAALVLDTPAMVEQTARQLGEQALEMRSRLEERRELPANYPSPLTPWQDLQRDLVKGRSHLLLNPWTPEDGESYAAPFQACSSYAGRLQSAIKDIKDLSEAGWRVVLISQQAQRLNELLDLRGVTPVVLSELTAEPRPGAVYLVKGNAGGGWMEAEAGIAFITDMELFGTVKQPRRLHGPKVGRRIELPLQVEVGDYVVHVEHGIARFGGTTRMSQESGEREYLVLEYAGTDRLYVPMEQLDRVARYIGTEEYKPSLSRLGTQEWERAKERVRKAVRDIARDLLATSAVREVSPGISFSPDTIWQQELETSFPYEETPDQMEAVVSVKRDMETPKPMDRLVCGDVGYGKTEVALRAAFKAVMDGYQVAVLVPTTVLAQQHYETFSQRLQSYPVKVEVLSRFRSDREQREIAQGLSSGAIDICIGTHRLVQKDISFKNLGLVIVDEEQRFGVVHKEHLKKLKQTVDVLTLTATPIPRTLHMALVGVRDMSAIDTPPEDRLPIKTAVLEFDERIVREAILREMDRGGQVFYVHNRVYDIDRVAEWLRELVPEASIAVGHGQMPEELLERVMMRFASGKIDLLLCTTIIESGLDMPNVNTIIVDNADKLGLAQLYQLRGRVGRGANRAYAYFFYDRDKSITETAYKRLQTIFEATELGAGFLIAMKDLEIRGAGNLLGLEQSGHIGAVGFDLYCRLLTAAVEEAKGASENGAGARKQAEARPPAPIIKLPLAAHLPPDYVGDLNQRIHLYRRLADVSSIEALEAIAAEVRDRFGPLPEPVRNLVYAVRLRVLGSPGGVESIYQEGAVVVIRLFPGMRVRIDDGVARRLPRGVEIGTAQVRLDTVALGSRWQEAAVHALEAMWWRWRGPRHPF